MLPSKIFPSTLACSPPIREESTLTVSSIFFPVFFPSPDPIAFFWFWFNLDAETICARRTPESSSARSLYCASICGRYLRRPLDKRRPRKLFVPSDRHMESPNSVRIADFFSIGKEGLSRIMRRNFSEEIKFEEE